MVLEIYRNCDETLQPGENDDPALFERIEEFRAALRETGREMVAKGEVSYETVDRIHMPMMSDQKYMAEANKYRAEQIGKAD